jgi:hypothetical protein
MTDEQLSLWQDEPEPEPDEYMGGVRLNWDLIKRRKPQRPVRVWADDRALLAEVAYLHAETVNVGCMVASINHEAAVIADMLAPELPWSTDEPAPDLSMLQ